MTEPTAEQVRAERERAHELARAMWLTMGVQLGCASVPWNRRYGHVKGCDVITTALARVRIEAHTAGRDEGLEAALGVAEEFDNDGRFSAWEAAIQICNAIRALRGRT